jgi:hypothetical protein
LLLLHPVPDRWPYLTAEQAEDEKDQNKGEHTSGQRILPPLRHDQPSSFPCFIADDCSGTVSPAGPPAGGAHPAFISSAINHPPFESTGFSFLQQNIFGREAWVHIRLPEPVYVFI